jgi:murein DD-endopeptidase MepM/ murein hydrolase activator NlpD
VVGTLFVVRVSAAEGTAGGTPTLVGRFADEPLHFRPTAEPSGPASAASVWAVAAVPVDASGALDLTLDVRWDDGRTQTLTRAIPLGAGSYRMERLTVAPRFGSPLSPELQRRTREESARAMGVARGAHGTPPLWTAGGFERPRATRITSGFGNGREFNGQVQSRHMGTDFNGNVGDPVLAPADGVVQLVDAFYLGGNVVYVDHGGGLSTGYLHLSEALVGVGDTVRAGQRIGSVGATGRVTGPHLHWIVRYGNVTVDPLSLVELRVP